MSVGLVLRLKKRARMEPSRRLVFAWVGIASGSLGGEGLELAYRLESEELYGAGGMTEGLQEVNSLDWFFACDCQSCERELQAERAAGLLLLLSL